MLKKLGLKSNFLRKRLDFDTILNFTENTLTVGKKLLRILGYIRLVCLM